jgi:molybdopterin-guanine dinucleotide biosynthesis protein A
VAALLDEQKRSVRGLVGSIGTTVITLAPGEAGQLANVNTLQEYEAITRAWPRS